jgi:hypothetical protein
MSDDYNKIGVNINDYKNGNLLFEDYNSIPPMFFTKHLQEVPFINRYNGGSAFLIASGPSFNELDKTLLYEPGILTMGLNNSPSVYRPNLWTCVDDPASFLQSVWMDPRIEKIVPISHIHKKLSSSTGDKIAEIKIEVGDCPNVFYYRRNEVVNTSNYLFEDKINWGNHSKVGGGRSVFLAATRILYLLGIRNLFLLGVDFYMDKSKESKDGTGGNYSFPQPRSTGSINGNNSTYASMMKWFGEMRSIFDEVGFKVYNCNPKSRLTVFPMVEFTEAIDLSLKNFPRVKFEKTLGMYTRKSDLEKEAKVIEAKKIASQYNEDDKVKIKVSLDEKRKELSDAKKRTTEALRKIHPEIITDEDAMKFTKSWVTNKPTDPKYVESYHFRMQEEKIRKIFKETEIEKNKIWGIVK